MLISLTAKDGHRLTAYACGPEDARAGIVVLPEIFGINAHIRQMADQFADLGYRCISPSLFDREAPDEPGLRLDYDQAGTHRGLALRKKIRDEDALLDIEAAAAALGTQAVRMVTGYCWGGYLSWRTACLSDTFSAASCWYGGGIARHCQDTPRIPVQMHFGGRDASIPIADIQAVQAAQPDLPIYVYPEAGHAFGRDGTTAHHPASAALAWERTLAFFARHTHPDQTQQT